MTEFKAYPKTPRLFRDIVITEKIDGTNAGIQIYRVTDWPGVDFFGAATVPVSSTEAYAVYAQSRKRMITPEEDNFGFARYVWENAESLALTLGEGVHYGEWWGSGIQRGYGLPKGEKRFSLFNVNRWAHLSPDSQDYAGETVPGLGVVPVLYEGIFDQDAIENARDHLTLWGSKAAPGFHNPEGIIVFHSASGQVFKVLQEHDEVPKGLVA